MTSPIEQSPCHRPRPERVRNRIANQRVIGPASSRVSTRRRFSAYPSPRTGDIRPTGLGEPAPFQAEPRHLLAQRPARDIEALHHGADLAAGLFQTALDHGALERLDLLRQGKL